MSTTHGLPRDPLVDRLFDVLAERPIAHPISAAEWDELIVCARTHGVEPLFAQRVLASAAGAGLPDDTRAALRANQQETMVKNARRLRDLATVVDALQARGIPVIVLKGMHLVPLVYRNLAARAMVDVDILVPSDALAAGAEVFEELGWRPFHPFRLTPGAMPYFEHQLPAYFKEGHAKFELHWHVHRLAYSFNMSVPELWERAVPARMGSVDVRVLTPEDLLLHVATHATYVHRCEISARACCDLAEIIARHTLDWNAVAERAHRWNGAAGTYLALRLTRDRLGAAVPDEVLAALKPAEFDERLLQIALRGEGHSHSPRQLRSARGVLQKLRVARDLLFVRREALADSYRISRSSPLVYGLYALRAAHLVWRLPTALAQFRGDGHEAEESAMVDALLGVRAR
jgi:hypothetical protein